MYYVMLCLSSREEDTAIITYEPDDPFRSWGSGNRFSEDPNAPAYEQPPNEPIIASIAPGDEGMMSEFWDDPVPLMTNRLFQAMQAAGIDNIDTYVAEIHEESTGKVYSDYLSFNIIGTVAAADLEKSTFDPETGPLISRDFDALVINNEATLGTLIFRLAESVNAIVVHEKVKQQIENSGINTLTFLPPEKWAG